MKTKILSSKEYTRFANTFINDVDTKLTARANNSKIFTHTHKLELFISDNNINSCVMNDCYNSYKRYPTKRVIKFEFDSLHRDLRYYISHIYDQHENSITLKFHMKSKEINKKVKISFFINTPKYF